MDSCGTIEKNRLFEAEITGYTTTGNGVCRVEGMPVFVPHTARGDLVRVRIVKVLSHYAFGRLEEILRPSPFRISPLCPVSARCGGCDFHHISYEEELWLKEQRIADALRRIGGLDAPVLPIVPSPQMLAYRNKAQFPVARTEEGVRFGFYRGRSRDLVPTEACLIQSEAANALARAVCQWADGQHIPIWPDEENGLLRHIYVRSGEQGAHLCLVLSREELPGRESLLSLCRAACPELRGLALNVNSDPGNRVLGERTVTVWGEPVFSDALRLETRDGVRELIFDLSPQSFYQVNPAQTGQMYQYILDQAALDGGETALDLYCGVGTITLALALGCRQVLGVEIVPQAIRDAEKNAAKNGITNVRFIAGDAGKTARALKKEGIWPDVLVCDPPRKGMDRSAIDAILALLPPRLILVSCDSATLARDIGLLGGSYRLEHARPFDMFPRTANVECVAVLTRR